MLGVVPVLLELRSPPRAVPGLAWLGLVAYAALAYLVVALACTTACSLHYDQQADRQTLDVEAMRPIPVNRQPHRNRTVLAPAAPRKEPPP